MLWAVMDPLCFGCTSLISNVRVASAQVLEPRMLCLVCITAHPHIHGTNRLDMPSCPVRTDPPIDEKQAWPSAGTWRAYRIHALGHGLGIERHSKRAVDLGFWVFVDSHPMTSCGALQQANIEQQSHLNRHCRATDVMR